MPFLMNSTIDKHEKKKIRRKPPFQLPIQIIECSISFVPFNSGKLIRIFVFSPFFPILCQKYIFLTSKATIKRLKSQHYTAQDFGFSRACDERRGGRKEIKLECCFDYLKIFHHSSNILKMPLRGNRTKSANFGEKNHKLITFFH